MKPLCLSLLLLAAMPSLGRAAAPCTVTEQALLGDWQSRAPSAAFSVMQFSAEGTQRVFNSWLHERPEISEGTWSLRHCVLKVAHPTEPTLVYEFVVRSVGADQLVLQEVGAGASKTPSAKFRRIKASR
jgi:hypothetical protein